MPQVLVLFPHLVRFGSTTLHFIFFNVNYAMKDRFPVFSQEPWETSQYLYFPLFLYCKSGIKPLQWVAEHFCSMKGVNALEHLYPHLSATPSPPILL